MMPLNTIEIIRDNVHPKEAALKSNCIKGVRCISVLKLNEIQRTLLFLPNVSLSHNPVETSRRNGIKAIQRRMFGSSSPSKESLA